MIQLLASATYVGSPERMVLPPKKAGCVIARGAEIGWDQPGRSAYDRTHAEL